MRWVGVRVLSRTVLGWSGLVGLIFVVVNASIGDRRVEPGAGMEGVSQGQ